VKLIAMADLFEDGLKGSHKALSTEFGDKIDVPPERGFVGFDACRKAIDCLRPGEVALCNAHAAFRPMHVEHAVEKDVHVFMKSPTRSTPKPTVAWATARTASRWIRTNSETPTGRVEG
jgi:hypothetical protein